MNRLKVILPITILIASSIFSGCITNEANNELVFPENTILVSLEGKGNFTTIQEAIDAAPENYTVFVYNGYYVENIKINKTVNLVGQSPSKTIIDGNHSDNVIYITADYVNVSNLTLIDSGTYPNKDAGIRLDSDYNVIKYCIFNNNSNGIYSRSINDNYIHNNSFKNSYDYGVYAYISSDRLRIMNNLFESNNCGLRIKGSEHCKVISNRFVDNHKGMYFCCGAKNNIAYHNVFINNSNFNGDDTAGPNTWYDDINREGNYWDDYTGIDENNDGIGDIPYNITNYGEQDLYPLMNP